VSIATGSKLVFMAGQVAWDADGTLVGEGDLAAQVEQGSLNAALRSPGPGDGGEGSDWFGRCTVR
jgi:hypothetical protein